VRHETVGVVAMRYGGGLPAELSIVTNGVLAERVMLDDERPAAPDFAAIVDLDLAKDLGQTKVLRGPAYEAVLAAVWALHDQIAPAEFGPAEGGGRASRRTDLSSFGFPLVAAGIGGLLLWSVLDDLRGEGGRLELLSSNRCG